MASAEKEVLAIEAGRGRGDSSIDTAAERGKEGEVEVDEEPRTITWRLVLFRAVSRCDGGAGCKLRLYCWNTRIR